MPACDPVDRSCQAGFECIENDSFEFCAPENGIVVKGTKWDCGVQESQGANFVVRGGLSPYGGRISGGAYGVTDVQQ